MPVDVAEEGLLAGVDHLHGPVRVQREHRPVDLHRQVLAAAERAADAGEVDAHLLRSGGRGTARPGRGRRAATASRRRCRRRPRRRGRRAPTRGRGRPDPGCRARSSPRRRPRPAASGSPWRIRIARTTFGPRVVAVAVPLRPALRVDRLLLGRALGVDDRLERLVLDLDRGGRPPRLLRVLGGDERDRLAEVAHPVEREHRLVGELEPVALVAGDVLVREDGVDAGHRDGLRDVDRDDARVRVRAAEGVAPEHPGGEEVARVGELAGDLRDPVDALDASPTRPSSSLRVVVVLSTPFQPDSPPSMGGDESTRHPAWTLAFSSARVRVGPCRGRAGSPTGSHACPPPAAPRRRSSA